MVGAGLAACLLFLLAGVLLGHVVRCRVVRRVVRRAETNEYLTLRKKIIQFIHLSHLSHLSQEHPKIHYFEPFLAILSHS